MVFIEHGVTKGHVFFPDPMPAKGLLHPVKIGSLRIFWSRTDGA